MGLMPINGTRKVYSQISIMKQFMKILCKEYNSKLNKEPMILWDSQKIVGTLMFLMDI